MQIFWQRRIREGDNETPYWYPTETYGGAMKENRIVLPIAFGKHWSDELPFVLPGPPTLPGIGNVNTPQIEGAIEKPPKPRTRKPKPAPAGLSTRPKRGLWFAAPTPPQATVEAEAEQEAKPATLKPKRQKQKNDPKHIAAARELRDRYLEEVNTGRMLPASGGAGKYDVSRQLLAAPVAADSLPLLAAA